MNSLFCYLRDFPDKVVNDLDFLHLLPIHLPDLADQNLTDEPVQRRLVQLRDRSILADLRNKRSHIAFLLIGVAHHFGQAALWLREQPTRQEAVPRAVSSHIPVKTDSQGSCFDDSKMEIMSKS